MEDYLEEIELVEDHINDALINAKLAYNYSPGSYTYDALLSLFRATTQFESVKKQIVQLG